MENKNNIRVLIYILLSGIIQSCYSNLDGKRGSSLSIAKSKLGGKFIKPLYMNKDNISINGQIYKIDEVFIEKGWLRGTYIWENKSLTKNDAPYNLVFTLTEPEKINLPSFAYDLNQADFCYTIIDKHGNIVRPTSRLSFSTCLEAYEVKQDIEVFFYKNLNLEYLEDKIIFFHSPSSSKSSKD